jgi:ClpP class serine protease
MGFIPRSKELLDRGHLISEWWEISHGAALPSCGPARPSRFQPLSEEAIAHRQSQVDAYYDKFIRAVARNRNVSLGAVKDGFGQGRMVMAEEAVAQGMADKIATLEETLARFGVAAEPARKQRRAFAVEREKRALSL